MMDKPTSDQITTMSDTPMTDLYLGHADNLEFAAPLWAKLYHGLEYHGSRYPEVACGRPNADNKYHSCCDRVYPTGRVRGAVTAYKEEDISPVRRPCKLCLAALRKAKKEAESKL